jgi:hypothetical protein
LIWLSFLEMTSVVAIEICATAFPTETACYDWIKSQKNLGDLMRVKGFNLRHNANAKLLTDKEKKRPVFQWSQGLGLFTGLRFERPIPNVVVAFATGDKWAPTDFPAPLPSTVQHEQEKAEKQRARLELIRQQKAERDRLKPERAAKRKRAKKPTTKKSAKKYLKEQEDAIGIKLDESIPDPQAVDGI